MQLATKLANTPALTEGQAREYDFILCLDHSGSMGDPSAKMKGKTRWQEAEEFTTAFARYAESVDDDGLTVIPFSSNAQVFDGVKTDKVKELFQNVRPGGSTNLTDALESAFKKKFTSTKPAIVLVVTDGEPDSREDVIRSIVKASNKLERDEQLAIQFVQIGDSQKAAQFLQFLDDNLQGRNGAKFDIVNTLTREAADTLTIEQILWLAIND